MSVGTPHLIVNVGTQVIEHFVKKNYVGTNLFLLNYNSAPAQQI